MISRFKIEAGSEFPNIKYAENYRKPPVRKSKLTEEERIANRKAVQAKCNAKRTKEYNKYHNDKQRAKNTESFRASIKKGRNKLKLKREKELEEIAGRPRPIKCEICNSNKTKICFDHCHKNGHFRGWICDICNRVLGLVKDDAHLLDKLSYYLKQDKLSYSDNTIKIKEMRGYSIIKK